jgi:hypothetical protein
MKEAVATAFRNAETLLRQYGFAAQADAVKKGLAAVETEGDAGYRQLASNDWWGGAGSVADVYLHKEGETFTTAQEKDNRALRAALSTIFEAMREAGFAHQRPEM